MKIRIKGNSIRYRLTKTEVAQLGRTGQLEESTIFPGGHRFHYRLERSAGLEELSVSFNEGTITLLIPGAMVDEWVNTDIVGFNQVIPLDNGDVLRLLIEKDFVCLDHTEEDQSDNYPNPNKTC